MMILKTFRQNRKTLIKENTLEKHKKYLYFNYHIKVIFPPCGAAAQRGPRPPC